MSWFTMWWAHIMLTHWRLNKMATFVLRTRGISFFCEKTEERNNRLYFSSQLIWFLLNLLCIQTLSHSPQNITTVTHYIDVIMTTMASQSTRLAGCLLNRLFRRRSKKTSKLRVTGLCAGNSPGLVNSPAQMASNAENVSIWWRQHAGNFVV